jgi:hypothetical protein
MEENVIKASIVQHLTFPAGTGKTLIAVVSK